MFRKGSRMNQATSNQATASSQALFIKVQSIVTEQLGVDIEEVKREADFVNDLGADSLDVVELVMAFEEAFDVEIPDEEMEAIRTVQDAVNYLLAREVKLPSARPRRSWIRPSTNTT